MLKIWLSILLGFFALPVGEREPDPEEPQPEPEEPQPELDLDAPEHEPHNEPEPDDPKAQLAEEKKARQAAEARAQQFERDMGELRARQAPAQSDEQRLYADEEARLKDPKTPDLERWQISANRELRAGRNASGAALFEARDVADRTAFRALEVTKPAIFKRYEKRVEEELQKARRSGANPSRENILRYLIGNDALDGKLASKKKPDQAAPAAGVKRGQLPGAKSDVRGKTQMSEHEKRRSRLENVNI